MKFNASRASYLFLSSHSTKEIPQRSPQQVPILGAMTLWVMGCPSKSKDKNVHAIQEKASSS